jgi:hypothetical protein
MTWWLPIQGRRPGRAARHPDGAVTQQPPPDLPQRPCEAGGAGYPAPTDGPAHPAAPPRRRAAARVDQLAARLTATGRRPIRPATVAAALGELHAAGLAAVDDHDQDELTGPWTALPVVRNPMLAAVELHGAHDLRHTYATWLEDAGIPARVIDELMGHQASSRGHLGGSAIGAHYRHTTPEMAARVVDAVQQRLTVVLGVAELAVDSHPNPSTLRVF